MMLTGILSVSLVLAVHFHIALPYRAEHDDLDLSQQLEALVSRAAIYIKDFEQIRDSISDGRTSGKGAVTNNSLTKDDTPTTRQFSALSSSGRFSARSPTLLSWMEATFVPPVGVCSHQSISCNWRDRFRSFDGSCNNLRNPTWGQTFTQMRRFLSPEYFDGVSYPRFVGIDGTRLPSARLVSTTVHEPDDKVPEMTGITHMLMQWGQFLDHDITLVPVKTGEDGSDLKCCLEDPLQAGRLKHIEGCFPIDVPPNDRYFRESCLPFPRSLQVTNEHCTEFPVEQMNQLTAYIDASMVYGSDTETADKLRAFSNGLLRVIHDDLMPIDRETVEHCSDACFKAGDERANEQMGLTSIHTVFMREHNRIVRSLSNINRHWDDERLYQEGRKIVGAIIQKITYYDFLPIVFNKHVLRRHKLLHSERDPYDDGVDASIRNSFATAAYRFGHTLVRSIFSRLTPDFSIKKPRHLRSLFRDTNLITSTHGDAVSELLGGLLFDKIARPDRFFSKEILNFLFQRGRSSLDLVSFTIQRGRDHGLPSYSAFREWCGLSTLRRFGVGKGGLIDHDFFSARQLELAYKHVHDIDLFSGGISERPLPDSLVGPTFSCLLARQFSLLKRGDRFWYERSHPVTGFTANQINEIQKVSLSRILCDNTQISFLQGNAFKSPSKRNPLRTCGRVSQMDLNKWKDYQN